MFRVSREKNFYRTMLHLMIPICLQNVLFMTLNMCDTLMLGMMESGAEIAINAAGLANQPFFIYSLIIFGMVSGSSVLISQYWGAGDRKMINKVAGIALSIVITVGFVVTLAVFFFSRGVLGIFSGEAEVVENGASYIRIVVLSYIPAALTNMLNGIMRSMEKVKVALFSNFAGVGINIVLNYCMIFGKLGFPTMGLKGAAYATLIARLIECSIVIVYVFVAERDIRLKPIPIFKCELHDIRHILKISMPVVLNETLWSTGVTMYAVILGNIGVAQYAAYSVANIIERIGMVFSQGMANAGAIIIGKTVGAGKKDKAYEYSGTMLLFTTCAGAVLCVLIILSRGLFVSIFEIDAVTKEMAKAIIVFVGFVVLCKSYNMVSIVGVLRGGGDIRYAMLCDVLPMWLLSIPLSFALSKYTSLSVEYIYCALLVPDEIIKAVAGLIRFKSKKWIKNITIE